MSVFIENLVNAKLRNMKNMNNVYEVGRVTKVKDYILEVVGLESVGFYERVVVANHSVGYVTSIGKNSVMVAMLQRTNFIYVGDEVVTTGFDFCAMYSKAAMGHIVDIFGEDRLIGEKFENLRPHMIETPNIPIMERGEVNRPLYTGISGIDLIYPIGFGQRQLIIGDKKTGKTQIALDTIVNQKDKNVICIYIAVNKTKKNIKELYDELMKKGAMEYTLILASFNDDEPPVSFFTPYAGLSIAEGYMREGRDVLVVIDDLKAHADIHREISLLAGKVPGRDAYPPDIFYTHSRLLEKGCQHKDGGSITILPIVETRGGDITDYISTNIISITDGQIVMSKKNFEKGLKPAINYGLSVSRLGGAVQAPDMKKLGAVVRRKFLSYLETKEVYQLANVDEMSQEMQQALKEGEELQERLLQYKFSPRPRNEIIEHFEEVVGKQD
ncbi:MAG TPA: F0F1 ATP synthase subunit alpha [Lachnospiraceae bacterium]|nr:F0F1 ATP synthase subunit alpha [Lachnospiraceae bacterium]